jgi:hypothetical protein
MRNHNLNINTTQNFSSSQNNSQNAERVLNFFPNQRFDRSRDTNESEINGSTRTNGNNPTQSNSRIFQRINSLGWSQSIGPHMRNPLLLGATPIQEGIDPNRNHFIIRNVEIVDNNEEESDWEEYTSNEEERLATSNNIVSYL